MSFKKICSLCLAMLLLFGVLPAGVQADAQTEQAQVLALVRGRIGDTSRYTHFDSNSRTAKNGVTTYHFEWATEEEDGYASLSVSCNSLGVITDYYAYNPSDSRKSEKPNIHKMPSAEAMEKAKALMDRLNPQLADVLVLSRRSEVESLYDTGYSYTVTRMENGIPFYGQTGSVRINAKADALESFFINYDATLHAVAAEGCIDRTAAQQAYAEKLGMQLVYKAQYKDRERSIYPAYVPAAESYMYIDAKTGEAVDMRSEYSEGDRVLANGSASDSASKNEAMFDTEFSAAELEELEKIEGLLDSESVLGAILKNELLEVPEGVMLQSTTRTKDIYSDTFTYNYRLESHAEKYASVRIAADAKTGVLKSFSCYRDFAADQKYESTVAAAKSAAEKLAGAVLGEYKLDESYTSEHGVRYHRYVNGALYAQDSVSVTVHPESGKVTNYNLNYTEAQFPSVEGVLSPAQAAEKLFAQVEYTPYYMARYNKEGIAEVKLVYVPDEEKPNVIEPFTGVLLNSYSGEAYADAVWNGYTDIAGHYAQKQLETLARFGIRFAEETCAPDKVITQAEFVSLLVSAFYNGAGTIGTETDFAYRQAENNGILTAAERADDVPLVRAAAAKYMICAMGLDEVASLLGIYICPFADVTENIGHISILNAMGVVRGDGAGNFKPDEVLTRADAAVLIYNYLSR